LEEHKDLLVALGAAMTVFDPTIARHEYRVGEGAALLAEGMGLTHDEITLASWVGLLHDHGRMGAARDVDASSVAFRQHPEIGAVAVRAFSPALDAVARGIHAHHEHWDGTGYPDRLQGCEIPLAARIVAVANAFDHFRHGSGWAPMKCSLWETFDQLEASAGSRLDPDAVRACLARFDHSRGPRRVRTVVAP
jgi:HD-GYP domain-containing protein (c-di-GMP phosphodiesterase class II)